MGAPAVHTTDWNAPRNRLKRASSHGKPTGLTRGSWVADLAALKKVLMLCPLCEPRFDARSVGFKKFRVLGAYRHAIADCDGCGSRNVKCQLFKHEETR